MSAEKIELNNNGAAISSDVPTHSTVVGSLSLRSDADPDKHAMVDSILTSLFIKDSDAQFVSTTDPGQINALPAGDAACIINLKHINDIGPINEYLRSIHHKLQHGGCFVGVVELMTARYERLWNQYPGWLARMLYWLDYTGKRVVPGLLPRNNRFVQQLSSRGGRVMSRTEILGRLVYCGFDIKYTQEAEGKTYIVARKAHAPSTASLPATGPLLKLERVGQHGETIGVYKLRTMHPYAQYLQEYVYEIHGLREGGKLAEDFRITPWGRAFRSLWLDEIPMIINVLKGDLKLVGVRPLSNHYVNLYTPDLRARRYEHKPGLFPPFYADLPQTIEEIMLSEAKYFDAYDQAPIRTDIKYLLRGLYNILVKQARSK